MFSNEEDIKIKLVIPYLRSLGFAENEISCETSFSLKIGKYLHQVGAKNKTTKKRTSNVQPRLDILVSRGEQNLFVVEVKADSIAISQDDIDQAISYGRLVHPIAPICLVTNGNEWRIVDTLSKKELTKEELASYDFTYTPTLPQYLYQDALQYFLGYSPENVLAFCDKQVERTMSVLKGSRDDSTKKFIPEIYEPRQQATTVLEAFIQSDLSCFVTVGDSGSGKTCWVCDSALTLLNQEQPIFFYRARTDLNEGIFQAMSEDLNWEFSPQYEEIQNIKLLLELFKKSCVLVFVDGLGDCTINCGAPFNG